MRARFPIAILVSAVCLLILTGCDPYAGLTQLEAGEKVYKSQCAICHQLSGSGVKDNQPALASSAIVNGDKADLIDVILRGSSARALADSDGYLTFMTGFPHLDDMEIAAVASYIRNSFGNNASVVEQAEVAAQR